MGWLSGFGGGWWVDKIPDVLVSRGNVIEEVSRARPAASGWVRLARLAFRIAQDRKMSDALAIPKDKKDVLPYSRPATPDHSRRVGVYGLGAIGYPVARNLANSLSSLPLVVYNRTPAKSEKLASELGPNKVSIVQSPAELVNSCDIMYALFESRLYARIDLLVSASQFSRTTMRSSLRTSSSIKLSRYRFCVADVSPDLTSDGKATQSTTTKIFVESSTVRFLVVALRAS